MGNPENEFTWKTDEQEKWEKVREDAFVKTLKLFIDFLKTQNQAKYPVRYAGDLIHGFTYTHMTSWNKVDTCRCILWDGVLVKPEDDAQLNVEIDVFAQDGIGECRIYAHTKGLPLTEGWHIAPESNSDDMMRELFDGDNPVKMSIRTC